MRLARIKVSSEEGEGVYHCISRVVNGERVIDDAAKEILRRQLWLVAEFCGVEILTYAILSNHFHVLVRVPLKSIPRDAELLRRYRLLHPKPTKYQIERLEVVEALLKTGSAEGHAWRERQLTMMGDVSHFMKLVKQRFTIWFNKTHQRFGTLWSERFKSVLIEPKHFALRTVAFYIDLNALRAGLVKDPKDYRFCGYGEAVAGSSVARAGLQNLHGPNISWPEAQATHRLGLFGTAAETRPGSASITQEAFDRVLQQKGVLPLAAVLRCRVRYFADGAVLGSNVFVEAQLIRYREKHGSRVRTSPRTLSPITNWNGITALRGLRQGVVFAS